MVHAGPLEAFASDADAVADGLAVAEHVVEPALGGVDDHAAGRMRRAELDHLARDRRHRLGLRGRAIARRVVLAAIMVLTTIIPIIRGVPVALTRARRIAVGRARARAAVDLPTIGLTAVGRARLRYRDEGLTRH